MKGVLLLASAFALIPMMATDAAGIQMDLIPSVRLEEFWESNVSDSEDDEVSSFGTRLSPGLALKFTSADNVTVTVSGNYEETWYYDSEAKDEDYNTWNFRINSSGAWALTPTISMVPSVYFLNTSSSNRRTQLLPAGDPVAPPVTIINYGREETQEFGGAVGFNYLVTPNVTIGISGRYSEQQFTNDNVSGSEVTDSAQTGGNVSISYAFSPRTTLGIGAGGEHQTYENDPDSDVLSVGILFSRLISPMLRFDGILGIQQVRQKEAPGSPEQDETSPSGRFNIAYTSESFTARAYGSYGYSGGSGSGEATRQYTTGLMLTDRFTPEWSGNLSGSYQVNRSAFETDEVDLTTVYVTAGLRYQPWQWGSLDLTGSMNRQTSDGQFGDTVNNYSATLGFTIGTTYNIF
jgi:hypothetical protein